MADVIQDIGIFNVKDELVFVDEAFSFSLSEEVVINDSVGSEIEVNSTEILTPVIKNDSISTLICKQESETSSDCDFYDERNINVLKKEIETSDLDNSSIEDSHVSFEPAVEELYCFKCRKLFRTHDDLAGHMESHMPESHDTIEVRTEGSGKRMWACTECDKTFSSRKGSVIHLRTHTGERPFGCEVCTKRFIDSSTLVKHQLIHQETRPFTCTVCYRGFNQKVALQRHESTHSLQPLFSCKYCPKTFLVRSSLQAHENIHSKSKPYICAFCPSKFHTLTLQKQHERVHTNERPFECSYCPKAFKDSGTLFKHQVIHSCVKPYSCPLCSNGFTQKVAVRKHIRTHVLKTDSKQCPICSITVVSPDELCFHLERHVLEHPGLVTKPSIKLPKVQKILPEVKPVESDLSDLTTLCDVAIYTSGNFFTSESSPNSAGGQFSCFYCGMRYKREKTLNLHLTSVHLFCIFCFSKFYEKTDLQKHKCTGDEMQENGTMLKEISRAKLKSASRQFFCEKCSKSFSSRNGFVIHQRSHTGERPYACRWCEKAFGDSATRHKHERIHTGERPFKCLSCPRAFNQRAALRAHQVTHSCDRAFSCHLCPSSFPYEKTLRKHVDACHADTLQLSCPMCSVSCDGSSSLYQHVRNTHEGETQGASCTLCDSRVFANSDEYYDHLVWHAKQTALDIHVRSKKYRNIKVKKSENKRNYSID